MCWGLSIWTASIFSINKTQLIILFHIVKKLHVIAFDVPYPADYGGVIVVYHQLKALKDSGIQVILHAYQYGERGPRVELEEVCEEVYYYKRATGWKASLTTLPYIVNSRKSELLLSRLLKDDYPILFEGVHTTAWISHPALVNRKKVVRMHNIEWRYYNSLYRLADNPLRKSYFVIESKRLKMYDEIVLKHADAVLTISENDHTHYETLHKNCHLMPAPHGEAYTENLGSGDYFLYHGKLSVADNKLAALHLMKEVFAFTDARLIVAGMNPDSELKSAIHKMKNVSINANPNDDEMRSLIRNAQANILYTFQDNGLKLKLLHALHQGRHCIVNEWMVSNASQLRHLCHIGTDNQGLIQLVEKIRTASFTKEMADKRRIILMSKYNNLKNTSETLDFLYKLGFK